MELLISDFQIELVSKELSGSLWLRQPVEDLRFDLGILVFFDKVKGFSTRALRRQIRGRKVISPK